MDIILSVVRTSDGPPARFVCQYYTALSKNRKDTFCISACQNLAKMNFNISKLRRFGDMEDNKCTGSLIVL